MTSTKKTLRATFAAVAAATLTMTATPAVFAQETATATPPTGVATGEVNYADSQASVDGMPEQANLVIHKTVLPEGDQGDGTRETEKEDAAEAVEGVKFTLYRLTNDAWNLETNEGWRKASEAAKSFNNLDAAKRANAIESGSWENGEETVSVKSDKVETYITNSKGEIDTGKLPRGIYGVIELNPDDASAYTKDQRAAIKIGGKSLGEKTLDRAMPFIVVLPMTDQDDTSKWLNTVNVYPKNSTSGITKEVTDVNTPGTGNGDQNSRITYTVKTDVPKGYIHKNELTANPGKQTLKTYQIADNLDPAVSYDGESVLEIVNGDNSEPLAAGIDYQLVRKVYNDGEMLLVTFLDPGLVKLIDAAEGSKVKWEFKAQVGALKVGEDAKVVPNTAYLIPPNRAEGNWMPEECTEDDPAGTEVTDPKELPNGTPGNGTVSNPGGPTATPDNETPKGDQPGKRRGSETEGDDVDPSDPLVPAGEDKDKDNNDGGKTKTKKCDHDRPTPPGPKAEVESKYGKVTIDKFAKGDETDKLAGAIFRLYTCDKDKNLTDYTTEEFTAVGKVEKGKIPAGARPVKVKGAAEWATDENGSVTIEGIQLNDWNNNKSSAEDAKNRFYCLVEVASPDGYELLPEAIQFQLTQTKSGENTGPFVTEKVANVPNDLGFNLPLTGGKGVLPLIALGGLLVVGAGGYAAVAAKRNRKEA